MISSWDGSIKTCNGHSDKKSFGLASLIENLKMSMLENSQIESFSWNFMMWRRCETKNFLNKQKKLAWANHHFVPTGAQQVQKNTERV